MQCFLGNFRPWESWDMFHVYKRRFPWKWKSFRSHTFKCGLIKPKMSTIWDQLVVFSRRIAFSASLLVVTAHQLGSLNSSIELPRRTPAVSLCLPVMKGKKNIKENKRKIAIYNIIRYYRSRDSLGQRGRPTV